MPFTPTWFTEACLTILATPLEYLFVHADNSQIWFVKQKAQHGKLALRWGFKPFFLAASCLAAHSSLIKAAEMSFLKAEASLSLSDRMMALVI